MAISPPRARSGRIRTSSRARFICSTRQARAASASSSPRGIPPSPSKKPCTRATGIRHLLLNAGGIVEMENTNYLGRAKRYHKFTPPNGGYMFKEYWLNHSYEDCDVFVSIAKLKEHVTAGVTMSMKNLFGITPCTIYGDGAPKRSPDSCRKAVAVRSFTAANALRPLRYPGRIPARRAMPERASRAWSLTWLPRVPSISPSLTESKPWRAGKARGALGPSASSPVSTIAGLNPVCTDAVGTALMGYDPMADRVRRALSKALTAPSNSAEDHGVGTRDLKRIEVIGLPIAEGRFEFRKYRGPVVCRG